MGRCGQRKNFGVDFRPILSYCSEMNIKLKGGEEGENVVGFDT